MRVPKPVQLGEHPLRPSMAATRLNPGVATQLGNANAAVGAALGDLIGAFGKVAGRAAKAGEKQNESLFDLEFNEGLNKILTDAEQNADTDGTSYKKAVSDIQNLWTTTNENRPGNTLRRNVRHQSRILRTGNALLEKYRLSQLNKHTGIENNRLASALQSVGKDPSDDNFMAVTTDMTNMVNSGEGMYRNPRDTELRRRQVWADIAKARLIALQKTDPEAAAQFEEKLIEFNKQSVKQAAAVRVFEGGSRVPTPRERREIFKRGGVVVNLDTNWSKGNRQTTPMVVIPDNASKAQRSAAEAYAREIAKLYKTQFGRSLSPRVVTRSQNGRGRAATIHTEPFAVTDSKAVKYFSSEDGKRKHAYILRETLGKIPGAVFSLPHNRARGDKGAAGSGTNEVELAKGLLPYLQGGGGGFRPTLSAYSPQAGGSKMEGGYPSSRPGPDGTASVRTLADVASGKSKYVTIAGNPDQYGKEFTIPSITYIDKNGKAHKLKNVRAVVHDTGRAFKKAGAKRFDVAIARDVDDATMAKNHARWKKEGVEFVEGDVERFYSKGPAKPFKGTDEEARKFEDRGPALSFDPGEDVGKYYDPPMPGTPGGDAPAGSIAEATRNLGGANLEEIIGKDQYKALEAQFGDDPNVKLKDVVDKESMAVLERLFPAQDIGERTVGEAMAMYDQVNELQQSDLVSGDNPKIGAPFEEERPGRHEEERPTDSDNPLAVTGRNGTYTFLPEHLKYLGKDFWKAYHRSAKERVRILAREERNIVKQMLERHYATLRRTGNSHSEYDPELVARVYAGRQDLIDQHNAKQEIAKREYLVRHEASDTSSGELRQRLSDLEDDIVDSKGDVDLEAERAYNRVKRDVEKIIKLREAPLERGGDPGKAVVGNKSEGLAPAYEVKTYLESLPNGKPQTPQQHFGLADAMMRAQARLGIRPTPLTKNQAVQLLAPLARASFRERRKLAQAMIKELHKVYGEYARLYMESAFALTTLEDEEDRQILRSRLRRVSTEDDVDDARQGDPAPPDPQKPNIYDQFDSQ